MHVYLQERIDVVPGQAERYLAEVERGWSHAKGLPRCVGAWRSTGAMGKWHEVYFLWEFDHWQHYCRVMDQLAGHVGIASWADPAWKLRVGGDSITLEPDSRSPSLASLTKMGLKAGLFMHEYIRVLPGKRQEYIDHYIDKFLPATRAAGRELVGIWSMMHCANDVLILLAIKDWATHATGMGRRVGDSRRIGWQTSAPQVRTDYDMRLLLPGPKAMNPLSV
ncbi:MAG: hypothetical protein HY261_08970 [Chloroflexi bacterium]|nr:hypothetical protein [Chloroflexota bacterium]